MYDMLKSRSVSISVRARQNMNLQQKGNHDNYKIVIEAEEFTVDVHYRQDTL